MKGDKKHIATLRKNNTLLFIFNEEWGYTFDIKGDDRSVLDVAIISKGQTHWNDGEEGYFETESHDMMPEEKTYIYNIANWLGGKEAVDILFMAEMPHYPRLSLGDAI